ncbi:phenylacetate--CoA ligase family protein [Sabulicella rubraurantiaca]|uniref:phenylacetate--CoA ligase family protein n=1 Tax=Sabulicella rubraurantiaca TaxID=2811429 RepID=UPI001A968AAC|nr:phenylacetate--CoA ligase family protein [Sabulicella rubraurantiaca]
MPPAESPVLSAVPGISWPAIPAANGAALLSVLFQLEQSQWWPLDRLLLRQREQLAALLAHAAAQVPFYRERLAGGLAQLPQTEDWQKAWRQIPILRREEIQAADASGAMLAERLPAGHGEWREIYTSGSTGSPIRSVRSQLWELIWSAFTVRDHLWHRRDLGGTFAAIRESGKGKALWPDGTTAPSWGYSTDAVFATGPLVALNITTPIEQQVEWLLRRDPDYLLTHSSIARLLAEACRAGGVRPTRLRQVITISENLRPGVREACQAAWGVPLVDIYSTREAGYLALQCPDHEHYHVQAEGVFLEVLREDGEPCGPGEVGRVVVTPLHNLAMPLIRYDIGDLAEVGEACSCGRGLPVLRRILGRTQNMLVLPKGDRHWPLLASSDLQAMTEAAPPLRGYQIVQRAIDRLELRLVVAQPLSEAEEDAITRWAKAKFGEAFRVDLAFLSELPRSAAGKFEDFLCEVP